MIDFLRRLLRRLLELLGLIDDEDGELQRPPGIARLEIETMARDVRLNWTIPDPRPGQAAVAVTRIDARAAGVDEWTTLNAIEAPTATLLLPDFAPGSWEYRAVTLDDEGRECAPEDVRTVSVAVPFDLPPGVETFEAVLE